MARETLFHGTNGDNILSIIESGMMRPGADGRLFFAREDYGPVFMHGGDRKRGATFAIKVQVEIPAGVPIQRGSTSGVQNTYIVSTSKPLAVTVSELFVRDQPGEPVVRILGQHDIATYLRARQGHAARAGAQ